MDRPVSALRPRRPSPRPDPGLVICVCPRSVTSEEEEEDGSRRRVSVHGSGIRSSGSSPTSRSRTLPPRPAWGPLFPTVPTPPATGTRGATSFDRRTDLLPPLRFGDSVVLVPRTSGPAPLRRDVVRGVSGLPHLWSGTLALHLSAEPPEPWPTGGCLTPAGTSVSPRAPGRDGPPRYTVPVGVLYIGRDSYTWVPSRRSVPSPLSAPSFLVSPPESERVLLVRGLSSFSAGSPLTPLGTTVDPSTVYPLSDRSTSTSPVPRPRVYGHPRPSGSREAVRGEGEPSIRPGFPPHPTRPLPRVPRSSRGFCKSFWPNTSVVSLVRRTHRPRDPRVSPCASRGLPEG